jgi:hypothetical protein
MGGAVAGVLWYVVLVAHVHFQIGVARYNALYSTFAALPLFLVWIFVSWIVVLFGAEIASAHDKPELYRWRIRGRDIDHRSRLFIALRALGEMARISRAGLPPLGLGSLAQRTNLPAELLRSELDRFAAGQLLVRSREQGEPRYAIARDLDSIRVADVTRLLEAHSGATGETAVEDRLTWRFVDERLLRLPTEISEMTLRQFSAIIDPSSAEPANAAPGSPPPTGAAPTSAPPTSAPPTSAATPVDPSSAAPAGAPPPSAATPVDPNTAVTTTDQPKAEPARRWHSSQPDGPDY